MQHPNNTRPMKVLIPAYILLLLTLYGIASLLS